MVDFYDVLRNGSWDTNFETDLNEDLTCSSFDDEVQKIVDRTSLSAQDVRNKISEIIVAYDDLIDEDAAMILLMSDLKLDGAPF